MLRKTGEGLDWLQRLQALWALVGWFVIPGAGGYVFAQRSGMSPFQSYVAAVGAGAVAVVGYSVWHRLRPGKLDIVVNCDAAAGNPQSRTLNFPLSITNRSKTDAVVLSFNMTGRSGTEVIPQGMYGVKQAHEKDSMEIQPVRIEPDKSAFLQMQAFSPRQEALVAARLTLLIHDRMSGVTVECQIPGSCDSRH
jgi:hypothetical protein